MTTINLSQISQLIFSPENLALCPTASGSINLAGIYPGTCPGYPGPISNYNLEEEREYILIRFADDNKAGAELSSGHCGRPAECAHDVQR